MRREAHPINTRFTVHGIDTSYVIENNAARYSRLNQFYEVTTCGHTVATIGHRFAWFRNQYRLETVHGADVPLLLCMTVILYEATHTSE